MKTLAIALFIVLSLSTPALAGTTGTVEVFFQPEKGAAHPVGDVFVAHHFDKYGLGVSAFATVAEGWATIYAGPTWAPTDWLELGISIGFEQAGSALGLRFEASTWIGYKSFSFLGVVECNPHSFQGDDSGVFFELVPKYQVVEWFAVGAKYRRPVGVGPLIEFVLPTTPSAAVWLSWAPIDPEKADGNLSHLTRFLVGLQGRF